jgi:serine/threonine protein kinase/Tol biopolymer transport system component
MALSSGTRLGPYEILSPLGAGGMGEVYRAKDTRLEREVAIKVLPEALSADPDALARFEREAKAVAALSHPNILGVYDLGREGATSYAAMELLTGETLRERLAEGALPQRKALEYGLQIAQGLAAAHEKGIVHRDLKPENLFVTSDGRVKILDFGLAKVAAVGSENTRSPTAVAATEPGTVMGTVGYMSPEQVRGKPADARSDIFSFGSVLYEMLSGERAFRGDSAAETMAAIAQKDPPELSESGGRFPPAVERVLRHCLEKRPEERFDTAHDLAFALETALGGPSTPRVPAALERPHRRAWRSVFGVVVVAAALGAGVLVGGRLLRPPAPQFRLITYHRGYIESARFSPDGQTVVYGATRRDEPLRIYSARLDAIQSNPLDLPEGATVVGLSRTGEMALLLRCAHHGSWIRSGTLATVALGGGSPREILEHVTDADISPDGKDFAVVREVGPRQRLEFPLGTLVLETDGWVSHPRVSPDGRRVAFLEHPIYGNDDGFVAVAPRGGRPERVGSEWQGAQGLAWTSSGGEIWVTAGTEGFGANANGARYQLYALRPGKKTRLVYGPPMNLRLQDISSSGAVLLSGEDNRAEVGGLLKGDTKERTLSTWSDEALAGISADGSMYGGIEQSAPGAGLEPFFFFRRAGDSAPVRLGNGTPMGLSPDGGWVVVTSKTPQGVSTLALVPTGPGNPRSIPLGKILPLRVSQDYARFSTDGRWLLFPGSEPGRPARDWLFDLESKSEPRAVTPEGSRHGVLSPDGRSVVAVDAAGRMWRYAVSGGEPAEVKGALSGEIPVEWETGGKALFVWDRTWPARIFRLDLETGRRELWKELAVNPLGLLYGNLVMTRDGQHYVYRLRRVLSELNVAEGLR